ncbi:MAG TPA: sensor domain-containing diguanylate cyclase [bacterium]|nr:sensor domain-containing diguanylate cyclase [bacterium]
MRDRSQRIGGALLGALVAVCGFIPLAGPYLLRLPVFFMLPLAYLAPEAAAWCLGAYSVGIVAEKALGLSELSSVWIWPEFLATAALAAAAVRLRRSQERLRGQSEERLQARREEFAGFFRNSEGMKRENAQLEKQLRNIEHLYDVIKEAGTTLSVQEMLEVAREFTERMFDLPHFLIGVLASEGKRFEIRVASGCDEVFLRSFEVDLDSGGLGAAFVRDKKVQWIPDFAADPRLARVRQLPVRSLAFFPFVVQDRVIGFLCTFVSAGASLDQETLANLEVFSNQIAIGLQKSLLYEKVQKLSITDGLTKLYSHRYFKQRLEAELILANRYSSQLSLLILDIDHFKHYNDTYGHVAGDSVLTEVAKILKSQSDVTHVVARYGGEEMVLLAPETTKDQALELAERIRRAIETHRFAVGKESTEVTVSVGLATFPQDARTNLDLISKADKALYAAKGSGRNRVVAYPLAEGGRGAN